MLSPQAGDRILDIGAGKGKVAGLVLDRSHGAEVDAVEPDETRLVSMKRDFPLVKSTLASAESLPYPNSQFDKVYSTMALHHFANLDKSLGEIARVLKAGGLFVVLEVDPNSLTGRLFRFFGRLAGEHLTMMTQKQLTAKLEERGTFRVSRSVSQGSSYLIASTRTWPPASDQSHGCSNPSPGNLLSPV